MCPELHVFGLRVPTYGLMFLIGSVTALICAVLWSKRIKNVAASDVLTAGILCLLCGLIGGKLLFILIDIPNMTSYYSINGFDFIDLIVQRIIKSGIVYYGGFIGGLFGIFCYAKLFKLSFLKLCDAIAPFVPLGQGFGRLGCFFGGCCYGVETDSSFSFVFANDPLGVNRVPVQLYESLFCFFILFPIMLWFTNKKRRSGLTLGLYIMVYSIWRFIIEFWRGDTVRGSFGVLSTSQWISVLLLPVGIILFHEWFKCLIDNSIKSKFT